MKSSRLVAAAAGVIAVGLIGGALALRAPGRQPARLTTNEIEANLTEVLNQIYTAFAEEDEARIYDGLAQAVADDLVPDLYLQRRMAQIADHAEGGSTTVIGVEPYRIEAADLPRDPGYRIDAAWRVVGRVNHRAHVHERINLYAADLTLAPVDGRWKLTAFNLIEIERADELGFEGGE